MADRKKYSYQVRRVEEQNEWDQGKESVPMAELNGSGVMIAFFIVICASGFAVWLLRRAFSGAGAVVLVFGVILASILLAVVCGMAWNTLRQFRERGQMAAMVLTAFSFAAALMIGVGIGLSLPVLFVM